MNLIPLFTHYRKTFNACLLNFPNSKIVQWFHAGVCCIFLVTLCTVQYHTPLLRNSQYCNMQVIWYSQNVPLFSHNHFEALGERGNFKILMMENFSSSFLLNFSYPCPSKKILPIFITWMTVPVSLKYSNRNKCRSDFFVLDEYSILGEHSTSSSFKDESKRENHGCLTLSKQILKHFLLNYTLEILKFGKRELYVIRDRNSYL